MPHLLSVLALRLVQPASKVREATRMEGGLVAETERVVEHAVSVPAQAGKRKRRRKISDEQKRRAARAAQSLSLPIFTHLRIGSALELLLL